MTEKGRRREEEGKEGGGFICPSLSTNGPRTSHERCKVQLTKRAHMLTGAERETKINQRAPDGSRCFVRRMSPMHGYCYD